MPVQLSTSSLDGFIWSANTYTTVNNLSSTVVQSNTSLETPSAGLSAISNIVALSQATYDALSVKLPTTLYVIV